MGCVDPSVVDDDLQLAALYTTNVYRDKGMVDANIGDHIDVSGAERVETIMNNDAQAQLNTNRLDESARVVGGNLINVVDKDREHKGEMML